MSWVELCPPKEKGVCILTPSAPEWDFSWSWGLYGSKLKMSSLEWALCCAQILSPVGLFVTPWIVVYLALLSLGFSRQEYWGELPFPPPRDLPDPWETRRRSNPHLLHLCIAGGFFTTEPPGKPSLGARVGGG